MPSPLSCGLASHAHRLALALLFQRQRPREQRLPPLGRFHAAPVVQDRRRNLRPAAPYPVGGRLLALCPFRWPRTRAQATVRSSPGPAPSGSGFVSITEQPRSSTTWVTDTRPRLSYPAR